MSPVSRRRWNGSSAGSPKRVNARSNAISRDRATCSSWKDVSARSNGNRTTASCRYKAQRHAVVAPPLVRRCGTVVEDVSLVTAAADAMVFVALDDDLVVLLHREMIGDAGEEAR